MLCPLYGNLGPLGRAYSSVTPIDPHTLSGRIFEVDVSFNLVYKSLSPTEICSVDGDKVIAWQDHSDVNAGAYSVIQNTSANRPLFYTNIFGSYPGIYFDGTNHYMNIAGSPAGLDNSVMTHSTSYCVIKYLSGNGTLFSNAGGGNDAFSWRFQPKPTVLRAAVTGLGQGTNDVPINAITVQAVSYDASQLKFYADGSANGIAASTGTFSTRSVGFGHLNTAEKFNGYMAFVAVFNTVHSESTVLGVLAFLRNKFGA